MKHAQDTKKDFDDSPDRQKTTEAEPQQDSPFPSLVQLQRRAGNQAVVYLLGGMAQQKCKDCSPTATCSACQEEEEIQRTSRSSSSFSFTHVLTSTAPHVQRAANDRGAASSPGTEAPVTEPTPSAVGPLIVADDATAGPNQMRKSQFLEQLRSTVCTTTDAALAGAGQSTAGCPYIEQWLSYYEEQEPAHIERALRKYVPGPDIKAAYDADPAVKEAINTYNRPEGDVTNVTGLTPSPAAP